MHLLFLPGRSSAGAPGLVVAIVVVSIIMIRSAKTMHKDAHFDKIGHHRENIASLDDRAKL